MANGTAFGVNSWNVGTPQVYGYGTRIGRANSSNIGASQAENQIDNVFLPALQQQSDAYRQALINANLLSLQSGEESTPTGVPVAGEIPATQAGAFTSVALTKDPEIEAFVNDLMSRIQDTNTSELVREPRSTRLNEEVNSAFDRFRGDVDDSRQSLEDFNREFLSIRPEDRSILDQENRVLGNYFGGADDPNSLISQLNRIAEDRERAVNETTQQALASVERAGKSRGLTGNPSSYLNQQVLNAAANIRAAEARDQADLARANLLGVTNLQAETAGRRGSLIDQYVRRGLLPATAQQALTSTELAQLGQLGGVDLANTLTERTGDQIARDAGLAALASQLRRGIRYEGLQQEIPEARFPSVDFGGGSVGQDVDYGALLSQLMGTQSSPQFNLNTTSGASTGREDPFFYYDPGYLDQDALDRYQLPSYTDPSTPSALDSPVYDYPGLPVDLFNIQTQLS